GENRQAAEIANDLALMAADAGAPTYRAYSDYALAVSIAESDDDRTRQLLENASDLANSVNNQFIEALAKSALGSLAFRQERAEEATVLLHEAMDRLESLRLPAYQWAVVQHLAGIIAEGGDSDTAGLLLAAANNAGRLGPGPGDFRGREITRDMKSDE